MIHIYTVKKIKILDNFFIYSSSDEETEELVKQKDNISPKDRKRKRHDSKKKVFRLIQSKLNQINKYF